ncbi:MAG: AAA family ATPase [Pseudomonadota bacterium]|nr:AAA family ATPase [Pseudomonadota bacterium]
MKALQILLTGQPGTDLDELRRLLERQEQAAVAVRPPAGGDPLQGVTPLPDLLVLSLGPDWEAQLKALAERPAAGRVPVILFSRDADARVMRRAMQAGARDLFTWPLPQREVAEALRQVARERLAGSEGRRARLTAVIYAKGGSGATVVACNVAHILAAVQQERVALLDLDVQFGTLPLYFDVKASRSLMDALEAVEDLDAEAVAGYMTKHRSGVHLLGTMSDRVLLPEDVSAERLGRLLDLLRQAYDQVVVDLPRQIDARTTRIMEQADRIALVMQQSLTQVRDAKRLLAVLGDELEIPAERIVVVVNRFDPRSRISLADIGQALDRKSMEFIHNDFKRVAESVNLGVALHELAKNAPVTRSLADLARSLSGAPPARKKGLLGRTFSFI